MDAADFASWSRGIRAGGSSSRAAPRDPGADFRPGTASSARYTSPIPPSPSFSTISQWPKVRPVMRSKGILHCVRWAIPGPSQGVEESEIQSRESRRCHQGHWGGWVSVWDEWRNPPDPTGEGGPFLLPSRLRQGILGTRRTAGSSTRIASFLNIPCLPLLCGKDAAIACRQQDDRLAGEE